MEDGVTELLIINQDLDLGRAKLSNDRAELSVSQRVRIAVLENIVELILGHITVMGHVNLANGKHDLLELVVLAQDHVELIEADLLEVPLGPVGLRLAEVAHDIDDLVSIVLDVDLLVDLLHDLAVLLVEDAHDVHRGV